MAYDSSIYGDLECKVEGVSPDTLQDEVKRDQVLLPVYVRTDKAFLPPKPSSVPDRTGMVANVDIKTGQKSVLII